MSPLKARQSSPTSDHSNSDGNIRKRVCKACDRCRLKKSKCDGTNPCSRCRADNAICVFGERKKAHDKVYPKGYVEMLEQQQQWLVRGLQELYRRACRGEGWPGEPLRCEPNGHPLTHDLLTRLRALDCGNGERFEENTEIMQRECLQQHGSMQRQVSSASSPDSAQSPEIPPRFNDPFARSHMPPTPPTFSPSRAPRIKTEPRLAPHPSGGSSSISSPPSGNPRQPQQQQPQPQPQPQQHPLNPSPFGGPMAMAGVVNPLALQTWPPGLGSLDEMDMMGTADYTNFTFEDPMSSPIFGRSAGMPCTYLDGSDEVINQYLNPREVTS
ncbi:hypothetical protein P168DRAFT_313865 [Aspergillus campestris IBT 28561]|uniref:Zn(2)-C6 fungal-type domain-containing protein n=1 Tax=Aspergillus campestris (strain IBT 28561) TaxID=1392248 RepID=A0A2I1DCW5_ASPC2|nr:uncharacterized protein P168DRAFT_313865 [Aspergillus campestris IBT 28561]PKY07716.1 hypothetical protein P168DRAFT_313865 [Aspergillus campestris IBT 28561]